jgi:putative ABC transport system substrate-binding protein
MIRTTLLLILSIIILNSCTENNTTNVVGFDKTLVLITDNEPQTEIVLGIMGAVRKSYPNVDVQIIKCKDYDISEAGYLLEVSAMLYPDNTCFAVIVEPGANNKRIVMQSGGRKVLASDNGLTTRFRKIYNPASINFVDKLSLFSGNYTKIEDVPFEQFYRESIIHLLSDKSMSNFGSICNTPVEIEISQPKNESGVITGEVLFVDNFGNCETNITKNFITGLAVGDIIEISNGNNKFYAKLGTTYTSVENNENVAFINSRGKLEISVNFGNMSDRYNLNSGSKVSIKAASIKAGIIRYNASELVDNIILGMKNRMKNLGFIEGKNIEYIEKNVNGDISKFHKAMDELINSKINIAIPVSTPAAKATLQYLPDSIPVVYTYVTSPEFAGLVNSRNNVTGLSDATNYDDYLKFAKELIPNLTVAGRIYNPSEPNSAYSQDRFVSIAPKYDLMYENEEINSTEQIPNAFNNLKSKGVTTILIAADNTVNLGMKSLADLAKQNKLVLIGDSDENVQDGALASISVDYNILAVATGSTVNHILLGFPADNKQIQRFNTSVITLNKTTAQQISFTFSQSMLQKASKIIE